MRSSTGNKFRLGGGRRGRIQFAHSYEDIISLENLLAAWREFVRGKRKKRDVQGFQYRLMDNVLTLHRELRDGTYKHGGYEHFRISDPKPRDIHKASVRDRLVHHALYRQLYPFFDRAFIADSYSCRKGKGTHKAMNRFRKFARIVSKNNTRTCWVLKCDIRKFFASIDHRILFDILSTYIPDDRIAALLVEVVGSFKIQEATPLGLPLGNLTSQLLVNVYMNEFDRFVKHALKAKHYVRYADDFVILSRDKELLVALERYIALFLRRVLRLELHPDKVFIKTLASGVDFLGWVHFPDHRVLRTATKRRMLKRLTSEASDATRESYRGLLKHGNARKLSHAVLHMSADGRCPYTVQ
jgi:RNA-directed DNA polymerase